MTDNAEHVRDLPTSPERRHFPRRKISDISYVVFLDGVNGGIVLDLSETGLLLQAALPVTGEGVSRLRFQLPSSDRWIEASAQLVRVGESGKEAGVRFLELPEGARAGIKQWLGNRDISRSLAAMPAAQAVSQQTTQEPSAPARVPETDSAHPAAAAGPAGRPERESTLPWRGLGIVICCVAVAVAILLGFKYSSRLSQLPKLGGSKQARNILENVAKTARSLYASVATFSAAGPAHSQSPGRPPNGIEAAVVPPPSMGRQPAPLAPPPKSAVPTLGAVVTQSVSPGAAAPKQNAAGNRSRKRAAQRRARRGPQPGNVPFPTHTGPPSPFHDVALVAAPAVGAAPTRVILEKEAVSASPSVAITQSRSILVTGSSDPTEELQLGKLVSRVEPTYPVAALARETEAAVRVRAFIGRSGEVLRVQLLSGPAILAPVAMNAIRQWRYGATLLNGQAIESQADVTIFFRPR